MDESQPTQVSEPGRPKHDPANWAQPVSRLSTQGSAPEAVRVTLDGRELTSAMDGFGQLWQNTFRVRLVGVKSTPEEVLQTWKDNFVQLHDRGVHFYPPPQGVQPGGVMPIDLSLPVFKGVPASVPMTSGVMIIYADELSFTVMSAKGLMVCGWNTFQVYEQDGCVVAEIRGLERATDPVYEFGYRFMGGWDKQRRTWEAMLTNLAAHYGLKTEVAMQHELLDPALNWKAAKNVWYNAAIRTFFYKLAAPVRWVARRGRPASRPA